MELKNAGVADVAVRPDGKIMASGGWDGRSYIGVLCITLIVVFLCIQGSSVWMEEG